MQLFASPQPVAPVAPQQYMQPPTQRAPPSTAPFISSTPNAPPPMVMNQVPNGFPSNYASQSMPPSFPPSSASAPVLSSTIQPPTSAALPKGLGKDANQAYEKLAHMDLLGTNTKRSNPFDTTANGPSLSSLAEMNAGKTTSNAPPVHQAQPSSSLLDKKPIMNSLSPPNPNPNSTSMVLSSNQQGNWGGYGATIAGGPMMQSNFSQQQQPPSAQPLLGHGYSQSGYAPYLSNGGQQQSQPPMFQQMPTSSGPSSFVQPPYYGYAAQPPSYPPGGNNNPW